MGRFQYGTLLSVASLAMMGDSMERLGGLYERPSVQVELCVDKHTYIGSGRWNRDKKK